MTSQGRCAGACGSAVLLVLPTCHTYGQPLTERLALAVHCRGTVPIDSAIPPSTQWLYALWAPPQVVYLLCPFLHVATLQRRRSHAPLLSLLTCCNVCHCPHHHEVTQDPVGGVGRTAVVQQGKGWP